MNTERMIDTLLELCNVPSISTTPGETDIVGKLHEILMRLDYFKKQPHNVRIHPISDDLYKRSYISAFMESKVKTTKTIILLSHFDVVGVEDYGSFKNYAFNPVKYTEVLKRDMISLPEEAKRDLDSGDYLFGRGTMDMKYGIAVDVEIMQEIDRNMEHFPGNILFLSVPDEEANSAGMLAAVETLLELKKEKQLEYICCLVSEPHFPKYPGDSTKYLYTGTVGKLLPVFYCVGKETHVGEPFSGLNPNLLTARIIEYIEQNPQLSDTIGDMHTPAPVCLKHADTKEDYSVQIPTAAYAYFNFMTLSKTPAEVLEMMSSVAYKAFEDVLDGIRKKARVLAELTGTSPALPVVQPKVVTYRELYELCAEAHGNEFKTHMDSFLQELKPMDLRQASIEVVKEIHKFSPYRDPMIVVSLAPPFYPHSDALSEDSMVMAICKKIVGAAQEKYSESLSIEPFFPGLSDMSYLGLPSSLDIEALKKNFPLWGNRYSIPLDTIAELNIPFINIGPLGKDAHKFTERICLSYSFEVAANLIFDAVKLLAGLEI